MEQFTFILIWSIQIQGLTQLQSHICLSLTACQLSSVLLYSCCRGTLTVRLLLYVVDSVAIGTNQPGCDLFSAKHLSQWAIIYVDLEQSLKFLFGFRSLRDIVIVQGGNLTSTKLLQNKDDGPMTDEASLCANSLMYNHSSCASSKL